jgi:adenylate cyclase class 2
MENEIEARFLGVDKNAVRTMLNDAGFVLKVSEYMMRRKTFDFSRVAPGRNKWGRIRQEFDRVTMTVKEVTGTGINDTFEVELTINDFERGSTFFEACNIPAKSSQENFREVWARDSVEATIDTWPGLKPFVEIEGPDEATVRSVAAELDFNFESAVFGSIDLVYERELGIPAATVSRLPEITFKTPPIAY